MFAFVYLFAHVQAGALSLAALASSEGAKDAGGDDDEEEDDIFETEFRQYKRTYYMTKIGVDVVSEWVERETSTLNWQKGHKRAHLNGSQDFSFFFFLINDIEDIVF